MQFSQMFDARSVEPSQAPQPIPAGDYKVRITASEPKPTKENDGGFLELTLQILEGQFQNRELKYRLNLFNKSQQAVEIAYRQLSALCHVTGVFNIQNSEQLHGIPFIAIVAIQAGGMYNDVKGVKDLNGNTPGKPGNAGVASGLPAAAPQGWSQPPNPGFAPPAPAAPAQQAWGPPAPAAAAPPWGPPAAAPPPQAAPQPWSPPGANMMPPPMQAPPAAAPAWGPPTGAPAQMPPPAAAAPPWAQQPQPQQPQPTAAPPTWPPK